MVLNARHDHLLEPSALLRLAGEIHPERRQGCACGRWHAETMACRDDTCLPHASSCCGKGVILRPSDLAPCGRKPNSRCFLRRLKVRLSEYKIVRMPRTTLRAKGQLTLPDDIRRAAHLEEGDLLEAELTADGILLRPQKLIDATQAWFWSPEWQAGEREADADRAAGRVETFSSGEEFMGALRSQAKRGRRSSTSA